MKELVYIGFAFEHHKGTHAGYHQIKEYLAYDKVFDVQSWYESCHHLSKRWYKKVFYKISKWIFGTTIPPYYLLKLIWMGWTHNNLVYHFIYGENTYFDFSRMIRKGNKLVCTFHQPVEWFQNDTWKKRIRSLDAVILVGKSEIDLFKMLTERDNVFFLPHGIDTDFYKPDHITTKKHLLLTVGNWLRDYEFADKVYQRLLQVDEQLRIIVVAKEDRTSCVHQHERLQILSGISDEELRALYLQSSVLFLPLTRYTANNSLLEASSCGCNIVIASDALDNTYIPEEYLHTCPMEVDKTITVIRNAFSLSYNTDLSNYIKKVYSWEMTSHEIKQLLNEIK